MHRVLVVDLSSTDIPWLTIRPWEIADLPNLNIVSNWLMWRPTSNLHTFPLKSPQSRPDVSRISEWLDQGESKDVVILVKGNSVQSFDLFSVRFSLNYVLIFA